MDHPTNRFTLPIVLFIGILSVSAASIFIRFAQRDAPSLTIAALRLTFASLVLAPIALTRYRKEKYSLKRSELLLGLLSGLFLAIHFATWISSLAYTTVASSVVLVSTGPLWVALLSPILLKEKLSRAAFLGLGLTLIGGAVIGLSDACSWDRGLSCPYLAEFFHGRAMWGNFLALAGAWAVTGYLIIGRRLRSTLSLIPYIFIVYSIAALVLVVVMFSSGETPLGYQPMTYVWLLLLALLPQLIGHSIYNWALRYLPAAFVAVTTLGEPIGSVILAYFILQEKPALSVLFGGILILVGIYLASTHSGKSNNILQVDNETTLTSLP
jgi:drug/metabolite transporter (DMT)-like permease